MNGEIKSAEETAKQSFLIPAEIEYGKIGPNGEGKVLIRSDVAYDRAGSALVVIRTKRKEMAKYFKEPAPETGAGPGQGIVYYTRKAWNAANDLFNLFDSKLKTMDETVDGEMKHYRAEVERKAREEAEARAAEERKRLEAEAAERRRIAEEERKRQEAELAEQRRKAEEERQKRLAAEMELAKSKKAQAEAQRKAEEEVRLAEIAEQEERDRIAWEAEQARLEAQRLEEEAQAVVAVPIREAPKTEGISTRKVHKARLLDLGMLVDAVAKGKAPLACLEWNESGCNKLAQAFGGTNPPPGLAFYEDETTVTRRKK
jgi:hypothetical protein